MNERKPVPYVLIVLVAVAVGAMAVPLRNRT